MGGSKKVATHDDPRHNIPSPLKVWHGAVPINSRQWQSITETPGKVRGGGRAKPTGPIPGRRAVQGVLRPGPEKGHVRDLTSAGTPQPLTNQVLCAPNGWLILWLLSGPLMYRLQHPVVRLLLFHNIPSRKLRQMQSRGMELECIQNTVYSLQSTAHFLESFN